MKKVFFLVICFLFLGACHAGGADSAPMIKFSQVPPSDEGGPGKVAAIEGTVSGARAGQKIVLYARSGVWWIQPFVKEPFTEIQPDSTWRNSIHLGTEYAALLVEPDFLPPPKLNDLPAPGNGIVTIASVTAEPDPSETPAAPPTTIRFSGYEWLVHNRTGNPGGTLNTFDPANVRVDEKGFLHLRIANNNGQWTAAEISLSRSLGYGTYKIVVEDVTPMEPAAVLSMFTWDKLEAEQNHREMNLDISRWGDPDNKNLQYVIQPYYVPSNTVRFNIPAGITTHTLRWEPGKTAFKSVLAEGPNKKSRVIAEYDFTSGIPTPKGETVHLNLYVFGYAKIPLQKETEVVIEKFEYLP